MATEDQIRSNMTQNSLIAGCDEAGAGCGVGAVVIAAVVLDPSKPIEGLMDSKKLTDKKRRHLYDQILERALAYSVVEVSAQEIDRINILQARMVGFQRAIEDLFQQKKVTYAVIDGNRLPSSLPVPADFLIQGDDKIECIQAASVLAKVTRDNRMIELDRVYPNYGFAQHKGYLTKDHLRALNQWGPCPEHRLSFAPVKASVR